MAGENKQYMQHGMLDHFFACYQLVYTPASMYSVEEEYKYSHILFIYVILSASFILPHKCKNKIKLMLLYYQLVIYSDINV